MIGNYNQIDYNLGEKMENLFDFGIIKIKWYSFLILVAMLLAYFIVSREAKKKKLDEDYILDMAFYGIIIGIIGARAYYVLFNLDYYLANPKEIIMIWNGGLAIHGGLIAALIFLIIYTRKKKINLLLLLDIVVVGVIIAQAIGRWGNFFNQEAYGEIVKESFLRNLHLPDFIVKGMYISENYREPTFLYESVFQTIGFIIMLLLRKLKKLKVGTLTSFYLIWYGIVRFFIEEHRTDSLMLCNIKVAQIVSITSLIIGLIIFIISLKTQKNYNEEEFTTTK